MKKLLLLLLVLPFLMAQTVRDVTVRDVVLGATGGGSNEQVLPNGASAPAGSDFWRCSSAAEINNASCSSAQDVDEGYQGTYDDLHICNDENVHPTTEEAKIDFATPTSSPTATTDAQQIRVTTTRTLATCVESSDGTAPTYDLWVYDGSSLVQLADDFTCGTSEDVENTYPWTYNGASDGSEVYVEVFDNGNGLTSTNRRRCGIEAIDWYAEVQ